ncbi:MAG: FG-GAP-like repeat-containing protein [Bacteroidia bacterium]
MKKLLLIASGIILGMNVAEAQLCLGQSIQYSTGSNPYSICKADFNNDGKMDLATANSYGAGVSVLLGDGAGTFGSPINTTGIANYPQGICAGDFNNDNFMDLAVTNAYGSGSSNNKVNILKGNGDGTFQAPTTFTVGAGPISICTGDFSGDGILDIATCNTAANNVSVAMGIGNGTFGAVSNYITMSSNPYQIICADFNGDGKLDLATADNVNPGASVSVYYNQGTGTFNIGQLSASGNYDGAYGLCAGDFTGDGKNDIAVTYFNSGLVSIIPNNGGGTFGTEATFTVGTSPVAICSGDFNGDNKLDVGVTNYNGTPQFFVMLGDGAGNLGTGLPYSVGSNPYSVISGDFDANGKTDVAMSNYNGSNVSVLMNGAPNVTITGSFTLCQGNGTNLSGTPAQTYTWSSGGSGQYEYVTPGVGTTSYTLTEANGVCTASAVATVTVTAVPTLTLTGSTIFCSADSTLLTVSGASTYNWVCSGPGCMGWTLPTTNTIYVNATHAGGNLSVNGFASGCSSYMTIPTFSVTNSPSFSFSSYAICSGQSVALSPSGSAPQTYSWNTGAATQSITVSPAGTTTYTLTETNTSYTTCAVSKAVTVSVTPTPTVIISGAQSICLGSNIVLSGSSATNYAWSANAGSATTQTVSVSPTTPKTYTLVESTPLIGGSGVCKDSATTSVNVYLPVTPNICMVTSDTMSLNNIIYWDKTGLPRVDSFIVYREVSTGVYKRIGAVSYDSLSMFVDTARSVGPANGDPNIGFYHYKLQVRDSCGNYSAKSPYHSSVFFVDNHTGTFTWNNYDVEGQATPVANFVLRRDNLNNGVYTVVGNVAGNTTTLNDPAYNTYQSVANWRIDATGFNCSPTARYGSNSAQSAIIKSKSNITNNRTTGVKNGVSVNNFSLYPNPTNGNLTIAFANANTGKVSMRVVSVIGQEAYNETFVPSGQSHNIDLSKCESGVYLVQVTTNNNTVTKRIVKN